MATGVDVGGWEFYRVLVMGIPENSNAELLLRTRLQTLPGEVVNIHTQGTTNAVVTLLCQRGHSHSVPSQLRYSDLGGSPLTIFNLGTESTTLVMENVPPAVAQKCHDLAPRYNVVFEQRGTGFSLSGLIDNIYNLRTEVDAVWLWTVKQNSPKPTASPSSQPAEGGGNVGGHAAPLPVSHVAPPPGMPAHVQPTLFRSLSSPATTCHVSSSTSASSANDAVINPLLPSSTVPGTSVHSSSHKPPTAGGNPKVLKDSNTDKNSAPPSSPTFPPPIVIYKMDDEKPEDKSGVKDGEKDESVADDKATDTSTASRGTGSTHTGTESSPSPSNPIDTPPKEKSTIPREYTQLNPDALALLKRSPEGEIPGIEYNIREGSLRIVLKGDCEVEEAILKFQDAYKAVVSRRLKAENIVIPAARSKKEVKAHIARFEQAYLHCAFVLDEEKREVRVISQSRQFEQAKQFLSDALQKPSASSTNGASGPAVAGSMVIALPNQRKLTLKRGDIVKEKADILVNAANGRLAHGGGVAGALNAASEGKLQKYSNRYMEHTQKRKEVPVGEVAVTHGGGNLKCLHVIHAVGPDGYTRSPAECERLVRVAIHNTLRAAERHNATSIVLPALSCGIFGVSKDLVARTIIDAIKSFHHTKSPPVLSDIRIVILDGPTHSCFTHYFTQNKLFSKNTSKKHSAAPDHKSPAGKPSCNDAEKLPNPDGVVLCSNDLPWIMTLLRPIAPKWKGLLHSLGVQNDHIMSIMDLKTDPTVSLNMGMSKCLQQQTPCTLAGLAAALSSPEVGEKDVAAEIVKFGLQRRSTNLQEVTYPSLPQQAEDGASANTPSGMEIGCKKCSICLEKFKSPVTTKCGHRFCKECIAKALHHGPYCPNCMKPLRAIVGKQPQGGTMIFRVLHYPLPGYGGCNTILIDYTIPSGVQGSEHPNPGQHYTGTSRTAYLPDNEEGREVLQDTVMSEMFLQLLQKAFNARMIFTIGTSVTTGAENAVVWNDIHHKTNTHGGQQCYGYPDPTYLQRVKEDLAARGIVSDTV